MMQSTGDVLVIDDDLPTIQLIAELLTDEGYTVRSALDPASARAAIVEQRPDLVLLDLHIPGKAGDVFVRDLTDDGLAHVPVVLMTADSKAISELSLEGIAYCLFKPFDLEELVDCVAKHMRQNRATV